ncbi:autotransporter outer membrane beta-barrel domain-containing protein [Helicobacter anatolicus]|uniref:autotransporter outer membrane beta-barrel domain-containing protein n=1 Tax=Helicobacter anatolicus TaxID=2905874 RepID=UPI001E5BFE6D|nr:autotransporter outer membrane beta-barrel domain-containing protein [Helicobacter anatolicus]MCE3038347.1 autotransporter outer membrane beta-barrel domain-containing protein [Helicobacter anatolicus]
MKKTNRILATSSISLILSSFLTTATATDVNLDLTTPTGEEKPSTGHPISFDYSFTKDGMKKSSPETPTKLTQNTDYFWAKDNGSTLSLKTKSTDVATAIFSAPGNSDNLILSSFNYISVNTDNTTKGRDDTYFAILNGPIPYASFVLNGANIFSGSNLYIGAIGAKNSKTGGFANVTLKGNIKVDANAIDQSDTKGSGQKNATLNFYSEYNNATYTIDSSATLNLTSTTSTNSSQVIFNLGETKDGTIATGQSVRNLGTINITNLNANKTPETNNKEKNSILFNIDLNNEGTINLQNSTLHLTSSHLKISENGSNGTINIKALATTKEEASSMGTMKMQKIGESQVANITNNSTIFFEKGSMAPSKDANDTSNDIIFKIQSQNINITGISATDASKDDALIGAKLTINIGKDATAAAGVGGVPGAAAAQAMDKRIVLLTGSKDKHTTITLGDKANDDRNTTLSLVGESSNKATFKMDNFATINIAGGAKLDLKDTNIATERSYTLKDSSVNKKATPTSNLLSFYNQGNITITGVEKYYTKDGAKSPPENGKIYIKNGSTDYFTSTINPNVSLDATDKKVVLTDYATTITTGKKITDSKADCTDLTDCTLETKETASAGSLTFSGGYHQILADVVYNFGNLYLKDNATLDLTTIAKTQDGMTGIMLQDGKQSLQDGMQDTAIVGFVNAGIFTSTGGIIELRKTQEKDAEDIDGMNANNKASAEKTMTPNAYKLIITENQKEKINDTTSATKTIDSAMTEGALWKANKHNETRAEFIVDSGYTTIRAQSLINKGLTTIQNNGVLDLTCIGTDYCYNNRYWTKATSSGGKDKDYVKPPTLDSTTSTSSSSNDTAKFKPIQIVFDNFNDTTTQKKDNEGILRLSGGTLNVVDSYRYQDKDKNYADVTKYIYHSLKIESGTLEASGNTGSRIIVGLNDAKDMTSAVLQGEDMDPNAKKYSALTLNNTDLGIIGNSSLFIFTQKDENTTNTKADVTWVIGPSQSMSPQAAGTNTFTMHLNDDSFTNNTGGFYVLGAVNQDGNYTGGVFNIDTMTNKAMKSESANNFEFLVDLSNLSLKNTILLDKQYNFIIAKEIQKDGTAISNADDFTMKVSFGKSVDSSGKEKPYGKYDQELCKTDAKFCLEVTDTNKKNGLSGMKSNGDSGSDTITIGNSDNKEGVLVVDKSDDSKISDITSNAWMNDSNAYADFVTFNKIYQKGSGNCNFDTLEGCALIGFSAVKSKTLEEDGVLAVFDSIKKRAAQLPNTDNTNLKNVAIGVTNIENANQNSSAILQSIINTNSALSSNILLNLQKLQYTGNLDTANGIATMLNTINNSLDSLAHITRQHADITTQVNFTSTLSTNARLAQISNPYNTRFAKAIRSLKDKKFAAAGIDTEVYNYTDRFDYDHNVWGMLIGGVGGQYTNGFGALGGFSAGYDKIFDRILLGGYATYAYSYSSLDKFNDDATANSNTKSHNLELGGYMRAYINSHEIDVVLNETLGFNSLNFDINNPINQKVNFNTFTTNINTRYGYVFPINPQEGFYIKPYGGINLFYQYNGTQTGKGALELHGNSRHAVGMTISAFAELRKYTDEKKYFYFTSGLEQDLFNISTDSQIYIAHNINHALNYKIGNQVRTYLTLIGGGEIEMTNNLFLNFGVGARISWDRYFINANVGLKYKFNTN